MDDNSTVRGFMKGSVIIPEWKCAYFWPLIRPSPTSFARFIVGYEFLSSILNMIIPDPRQLKVYKSHRSAFHWMSQLCSEVPALFCLVLKGFNE